MNKRDLVSQIKAANKEIKCDLVIKNITVIDVFQSDTFVCDVGIKNGYIVGLGKYDGIAELDGTNKYICPGLIDTHAHIESSLITPHEYGKEVIKHGVTSVVIDPHEIANVLGIKGIEFILEDSEDALIDFYVMLSSCVPATSFENNGAILKAEDLKDLYNHPRVLGLAEVMDYPAVLNTQEDMIQKIIDAKERGLVIDGHGAGFNTTMLNAYLTAGITTDHESIAVEEVIERLRRGMYVLMREGTVAKNLNNLIEVINSKNSRRIALCSDDLHIDDLVAYGSINHSIKMAIDKGIDPIQAIQLGTLNASECYKLNDKGAIAPGYIADFIILDDLQSFKINSVYKNGDLVVYNNKVLNIDKKLFIDNLETSMNLPNLSIESFKIDTKNKSKLNVIEVIPNKLETKHLQIDLNNEYEFKSNTNEDLLKIAVIERHKSTGNIGLGVVKGFQMKSGAIATTVAHDSHNLIVTGTNDEDMLFASLQLKELGGGIIVVMEGQVLAAIELDIAGLMTTKATNEVLEELKLLHESVQMIAPTIDFNPFLTLSFLSLPVIPSIKLTDMGLFDVDQFKFIETVE